MNRRNFFKTIIGAALSGPFLSFSKPKKVQRKLKAVWTLEAAQDLKAIHSVSTDFLARKIADEMSRSEAWLFQRC